MFAAVAIVVASILLIPLAWYILAYTFNRCEPCPGCSTKIFLSRFKSGKACPTCGFTTKFATGPTAADLGQQCHECSLELTARDAVQLWDGETYCLSRVGRTSELLLARASKCPQFQEIIRPSFREIFGADLKWSVANVSCALVTLMTFIWIFGFVISVSMIVVTLLYLAAAMKYYKRFPRHVAIAIRDGILMSQSNKSIADFALKDCVWFETQHARIWVNNYGPSYHYSRSIKAVPQNLLMHGPAIVIRTPPRWQCGHSGQIAVGFSAESYEIWRSMLTIAGLPKMPSETNTSFRGFYDDTNAKAFYDELAKAI